MLELEMIDMGDAMLETKQPHIMMMIPDSCCTWGYW